MNFRERMAMRQVADRRVYFRADMGWQWFALVRAGMAEWRRDSDRLEDYLVPTAAGLRHLGVETKPSPVQMETVAP